VIHVYRYLAALTVLLLACSTYAVAVAPWFEPPEIAKRATQDEPAPLQPGQRDANEELARLFPPDHWVRKNPKIVETEQCTLLIQDYKPLPDGRLELKPCVLIFHAGGTKATAASASQSPARGRPIVLEAPKAELTFDRAVDFARAEFGRVEKGTLSGEVSIYSPPTVPGGRDELRVRTRAVWLDRQSIRTSNEVEFQYGDSSGRGRILEIALRNGPSDAPRPAKAKLGAIHTVTLKHLDYLRLATQGPGLLGNAIPADGKAASNQSAPLEVTCKGEFNFDMIAQLARFERQVEVRRLLPGAPPDQLHCEELLLAFAERKAPALTTASAAPSSDSALAATDDPLAGRLSRIVAIGGPAVLDAPSSGVHAVAAFMEYSVADRFVTLKSSKQVPQAELRQHEQHFIAPELHYQMADEGRLGRMHATGPGELRLVQDRGGERQIVTARWEKELQVQPQERNHVISLVQAASVTIDPVGRFDGNELYLWVREVPVETGQPNGESARQPATNVENQKPKTALVPDRLLAIGKVHVVSTQLDVDTDRLEAWFINLPAEPAKMQPLLPPQRIREPVEAAAFLQEELPQGTIRGVVRQPSMQKFHVSGAKIQMQAVVRGRLFDLEDLNIDGEAAIEETRTPEPGQEPIRVRGELLELRQGTKPDATIQVSGRPAEVSGRGMRLAGGQIQVQRGKNEMRIDGPGEATLPGGEQGGRSQEPGATGQAGPPQKMHLVWQEGLLFNGLVARFAGDVQVRTGTQVALAPVLEATLSQRFDFQAMGGTAGSSSSADARVGKPPVAPNGQPELASVFLDGGMRGVYVENRGSDEFGQQTSREQMKARNLTVDRIAGKLHAAGPGWVNSVRRGSAGLPGATGSAGSLPAMPSPQVPNQQSIDKQPLTSIHVAFEREMVGDLSRREIEFRQQVLTTYSPANDFNDVIAADPLGSLDERMVLMRSDLLTITEFIQPSARWFEMRATGHTTVHGQKIDVDAPIVGYSSDKDVLTLEGDGRAEAKAWLHRTPGDDPARFQGQRLQYNLRTGQMQTDGIKNFHIPLGPNIKIGIPALPDPAKTKAKTRPPRGFP
jgi:hypothetical protein